MEADEREVGGQLVALERAHLRPVGDHERDAVPAEQVEHLVGEPALVPELDRVAKPGGNSASAAARRSSSRWNVGGSCHSSGPSFGEPTSGSMRSSSSARCSAVSRSRYTCVR